MLAVAFDDCRMAEPTCRGSPTVR